MVPNGAVDVQGAAIMAFLWLLPGLTSRNTITWGTVQWTTEIVFRDVISGNLVFLLLGLPFLSDLGRTTRLLNACSCLRFGYESLIEAVGDAFLLQLRRIFTHME